MATPDEVASLRAYFHDVFASPMGRRVLSEIQRFCRVHKTTHVLDDPSGRNSANLEGKRAVALYIEAMASEADDLLRTLLEQENP